MKVLLFAVSEGASVDQETNLLSIYNIIDEITPVGLPLLIPKAVINLVVQRDETDSEEVKGSIIVKNNENDIHTLSADLHFGGASRARLRVTVNGLPVHETGKLSFRYVASQPAFDAELLITVSEPEAVAAPTVVESREQR